MATMVACAAASPAGTAPRHAAPVDAPVYSSIYGPDFSQNEHRNNYNSAGEYRVILPDGRVQIVTYSDSPDGLFHDVKYEGEA